MRCTIQPSYLHRYLVSIHMYVSKTGRQADRQTDISKYIAYSMRVGKSGERDTYSIDV